jgi:hypothetical protein
MSKRGLQGKGAWRQQVDMDRIVLHKHKCTDDNPLWRTFASCIDIVQAVSLSVQIFSDSSAVEQGLVSRESGLKA